MGEVSRTKRTLQNSRMSLTLFLVQIVVGFYSRKVFLDYLGAEVLGLNTTLGNILSFMNLAELGIGTAMATSLYKPIHDEDHEKICEIVTVQGRLYRRVALLICIMGGIVMLLLPFIFPHTECGILYVYIAFSVFLFGSVSGYLWNYRLVLIYADQKNFRIMPWMHGVRYTVLAMQISSFMLLDWGVWGWISLEFIGNVATIFVVNHVLKTEYPWLRSSSASTRVLLVKYHDLIVKTKQLFVHKLGSFVLDQTAPLIIYAFVSLTMVTYYGNYMIVIGYVSVLLNTLFTGMGASIGSLVAEGNKGHTMDVFWELFTSRIWIATLACFGIYLFIAPTISLWLGEQYVLSHRTLIFLLIGMFIRFSRSVIDSFKEAYQLFADVWAPAVEAALNLGCSVAFGYLWGLDGIIMGSNVSLILIVVLWKPYYVFRNGLRSPFWEYYRDYTLHLILLTGTAIAFVKLWPARAHSSSGFMQLLELLPCFIAYALSTFVILYVTTKGMRRFAHRIINIICHRL